MPAWTFNGVDRYMHLSSVWKMNESLMSLEGHKGKYLMTELTFLVNSMCQHQRQ